MRNLKLVSKNRKFQHITSTESLDEIMDDCQGLGYTDKRPGLALT